MKAFFKFCLTFIYLSLSNGVFSQNFISENKVWNIVSEGGMEQTWTRTSSFKFSGDTTVQQTNYKKLYFSDDEQKENWALHSLWFERNDSVFKYPLNTEEQLLVYDFNISVNDSFLCRNAGLYLYVDSIKTKEWGKSEREFIYFHSEGNNYLHTIWIKGVGQNGLITRSSEVGITGGISSILCFEENGQLIYQNPEYNSCYVFTTVPTIKKKQNLIEVHNTCENLITVKSLSSSVGIIEVYTITGHKIVAKKIELTGSTIKLPSNGVYIYRFTTHTGDTQTGKVLVR